MSWTDYTHALESEKATGQATEHTYRPAFKALLEFLGDGVQAINEPVHAAYGAPDFIVERSGAPIGHVECKDIGADLDAVEQSEQLQRYLGALPNLILTDYLEFRWYVNGEKRDVARLGWFSGAKLHVAQDDRVRVQQLLANFFDEQAAVVTDAADLARRMAGKTRMLYAAILDALWDESPDSAGLRDLYEGYKSVLISDLSDLEFADLQAQTAAYGLFAARCIHDGSQPFTRQSAVFAKTTPFLADVFSQVAGPSAYPGITWIIDDLAKLLARANMNAILADFGRRTRQEDPVVHFYEDFLRAYNPDLREMRGVYYTPEPVVSYIVRSVDHILRDRFGIADGLADTETVGHAHSGDSTQTGHRVLILDPAVGTGTFLKETIAQIRRTLSTQGLGGTWASYVRHHLLPRLFGFELLMAPYAICHLKLALELSDQSGFTMPPGERLGVYLTNSLEEATQAVSGPMFAQEIAREAREADDVRSRRPVMVVIGNPPYSGHSANMGEWISDLLRGRIESSPEGYFTVDNQRLSERNPKWLNDDYVKFIRFAQWRIEQTGEGVLGFVTNHAYLDNPTFRGMRQSLRNTFDEIYILDLHGNSRRTEQSPDGGVDENVFDIQQGVAIGVFVKRPDSAGAPARVFHAERWGKREGGYGGKYGWLSANDVQSTEWTELTPKSPEYFFIPRNETFADEYEAGWKITSAMPVNSVGVVTARDRLAIKWTAEQMREVAEGFASLSVESARRLYPVGTATPNDRIAAAQEDVRSHPDAGSHVRQVLYRPFDTRWTYYTGVPGGFLERPRESVMRHMLAGANLGIMTCRGTEVPGGWRHLFVTSLLATHHTASIKEVNYLFPLYLYPESYGSQMDVGGPARRANLAPGFVQAMEGATGLTFEPDGRGDLASTFGPEDALAYIYAILHSPAYRLRYADFLKSDFPRIPLPRDAALFRELAAVGDALLGAHLRMEAPAPDRPAFPVAGNGGVTRVAYATPAGNRPGRVWINQHQYFEGVSQEVWDFTIGGYRPVEKWLKDRKNRALSFDDVAHYQRICAVLAETPRLMARVDDAIDAHGGWPLTAP